MRSRVKFLIKVVLESKILNFDRRASNGLRAMTVGKFSRPLCFFLFFNQWSILCNCVEVRSILDLISPSRIYLTIVGREHCIIRRRRSDLRDLPSIARLELQVSFSLDNSFRLKSGSRFSWFIKHWKSCCGGLEIEFLGGKDMLVSGSGDSCQASRMVIKRINLIGLHLGLTNVHLNAWCDIKRVMDVENNFAIWGQRLWGAKWLFSVFSLVKWRQYSKASALCNGLRRWIDVHSSAEGVVSHYFWY